jgi:hypothetical protein
MPRLQFTYPKFIKNIYALRQLEMLVIPKVFGLTVAINILANGQCTLSCPACPVSTIGWSKKDKRRMTPETFRLILDKLIFRDKQKIREMWLSEYNEPLLHDKVEDFVKQLSDRKIPSYISSNLQSMRKVQEVFDAGLNQFRVSISGWSQRAYGKHHGGDVETVKKNMYKLRVIASHSDTTVYVHFHRWKDNVDEEDTVRRWAQDLGFTFTSEWAWVKPVSLMIAAFRGEPVPSVVNDLNWDMVLKARMLRTPCRSQYKWLLIDVDGSIPCCCNSPDDLLGNPPLNFLTTPLKEIRTIQRKHPLCVPCQEYGLHAYYSNISELE